MCLAVGRETHRLPVAVGRSLAFCAGLRRCCVGNTVGITVVCVIRQTGAPGITKQHTFNTLPKGWSHILVGII